jgi:hypothetical protein
MFRIILLFLFGFGNLAVQAQQTIDNPIVYFDFFNQEHSALAQKNMEYLQYAVHSDDLGVIAEKRLALLAQVQQSQARMSQLPDFAGDTGLKATMTEVLQTYEELFEVGFQEVEFLKLSAQDGFDQMEKYLAAQTAAEQKMAGASAKLLATQQQFAKANNILLQMEPGSVTEAQQLNALNEYQRNIFLRSFRVGKLNAQFLLAIEQEDTGHLEQIRQQLLQATNEEIPQLKKVAAYNGDTAYRDAVVAQLEILQALAKDDYPALVKVKAKGDQLTQEDVDAFNTAISKVNTQLNPATEKINIALQNLLRNNVPKPALRGVKQI